MSHVPYYDHDGITIYCGDCRDVLAALPCLAVDALLTDPPYGIGFAEYVEHDDARETYETDICARVLEAEGCVANGWCAVYQSATRGTDWARLFPRPWRPIAMPKTFAQVHPGTWPLAATDYVLLWRRGQAAWPTKGARVRDWFLQATSDMSTRPKGHPCPRPLDGCKHIVTMCAPPGGIVLDPFMGSGTTLVAAKQLSRRAIGIEISEDYCRLAVDRLRQGVLPLGVP